MDSMRWGVSIRRPPQRRSGSAGGSPRWLLSVLAQKFAEIFETISREGGGLGVTKAEHSEATVFGLHFLRQLTYQFLGFTEGLGNTPYSIDVAWRRHGQAARSRLLAGAQFHGSNSCSRLAG